MELSDIPFIWIIIIILFMVVVGLVVKVMYETPHFPRMHEGFESPDCLRTLPEAAVLLAIFTNRGSADYKELELLLRKMACLKNDLTSPKGLVESTTSLAFETAHDRMPVAEVCAMCMSKTISPRDLDIVCSTWRDRSKILLRSLATECHLSEAEVVQAEGLFKKAYDAVYQTATTKCLKTDLPVPSDGDVGGFEPPQLIDHQSYDFKYGGLSASGWGA